MGSVHVISSQLFLYSLSLPQLRCVGCLHRMPSFENCSYTGPYSSSSPRPPAPLWVAHHELLLWPVACFCGGSPWIVTSFRPHPLLYVGSSTSCTQRSAPWVPMGCREAACSTVGPLLGFRELLLCPWNTSCPSILTLVPPGLFLSHFLTFPSQLLLHRLFSFLNLLSHRQNEHCSWLSSGPQFVPFEARCSWLLTCMGQLLCSAHSSHPCSPPNYQNLGT